MARSRVSASRSDRQVASRRSRTSRVTARLLLRCRGRVLARTASRSAARRLGERNGPSCPFQRCKVPQLASRRLTVDGACGPSLRSSTAFAQPRRDLGRHAVLRDRSRAWPGPTDGARQISAPGFPRPARATPRRSRPAPRPRDRRDRTPAPAANSRPCPRARDASASRRRRRSGVRRAGRAAPSAGSPRAYRAAARDGFRDRKTSAREVMSSMEALRQNP